MINHQSNQQPVMNFTIPAKHMEIRLVRASETYLLGSRGSLKTTFGCAMYAIDMIYEMPRSTGVIVVLNYEHFDLNTITPLLKGWASLGYREGEHFVMDKRPPDDWPKPYDYNGEREFKRTFTWHNGTMIKVLSLARMAAANAISAQWGFFDELKFMNTAALAEVFPIFRGNEEYFGKSSCYLSKFFATDKLADPAEIEWILKKRDAQDYDRIADVIALQLKVNELKQSLAAASTKKEQSSLQVEIFELEDLLRAERNGLIYVPEINCYDVLPILGDKWLQAARSTAKTQRIWEVAYENKDPEMPGESFYPKFEENRHGYDLSDDIDVTQPLIIASDYQHSVAPLPVAQLTKLPGNENVSLNYIDYLYGKHPEGLKDTIHKFCDAYAYLPNKKVFYVYDHTAIGRRQDADDFCTIVTNALKARGWTVYEVYTGQAPLHFQKYSDTIDWMEESQEAEDLIPIRINKKRAPRLILSIKNSAAKTSNGQTKKDKKYEDVIKYPDVDQSITTHGSDAFDQINDAVLKQKLIKPTKISIPIGFARR